MLGSDKGNTLTCVGKTDCQLMKIPSFQKHPHMRGEDYGSISKSGKCSETPPHAWGRQRYASYTRSEAGNTPTCVGKNFTLWYENRLCRKHPHMRGEDRIDSAT